MMKFTQALDILADKTGINTQSIDYEDATNLIMDIYDSIGSCEECRFSTEHVNNKLIDCSRGYWSHTKRWYCADFERRNNEMSK